VVGPRRLGIGPFQAHIGGMKHYEVKLRQTTGGWIWQLYDGVSPTWIENSGMPFKTPEEAALDGAKAQARHELRDALNRKE
jgi:hypothetical protein